MRKWVLPVSLDSNLCLLWSNYCHWIYYRVYFCHYTVPIFSMLLLQYLVPIHVWYLINEENIVTNHFQWTTFLKVQLQRSLALAKESKMIFEIVTVRLLSEFRYFQEQKVHDLGEILQNFLDKQVTNSLFSYRFFHYFEMCSFCYAIFLIPLSFSSCLPNKWHCDEEANNKWWRWKDFDVNNCIYSIPITFDIIYPTHLSRQKTSSNYCSS